MHRLNEIKELELEMLTNELLVLRDAGGGLNSVAAQ
jgi:hypothetical protein